MIYIKLHHDGFLVSKGLEINEMLSLFCNKLSSILDSFGNFHYCLKATAVKFYREKHPFYLMNVIMLIPRQCFINCFF